MDSTLWAKAHGASTHFPIALVLCSVALDLAAFALADRQAARDLHAAGYWTMIVGAFGSMGAVVSGLVMTKGSVLGHDALRMHHLFVWPAFGLLIGAATWRVAVGRRITRSMIAGYLIAMLVVAALMTTAGYWGGEMMIAR